MGKVAKSAAERKAELLAKHAEELTALEREEALTAVLPAELLELAPWCHASQLYGTVGVLSFKHDFYAYGQAKPQPTLATARRLAEVLPAVPLVLVADGCKSIRPRAWQQAQAERPSAVETPISAFRVNVSGFQQRTAEIEWVAQAPAGLVSVKVLLPLSDAWGRLDIVIKDIKGGRRVERCEFNAAATLQDLQRAELGTVAQLEHRIKWARGSEDTPNDFTLVWVDVRDDASATVADLVNALGQ